MQAKEYMILFLLGSVLTSSDTLADSIGVNAGYSQMYYDLNTNIKDLNIPSTDFIDLEVYLTFKNIFNNKTIKPTINYIFNGNNDLNSHTLLVGINKYFLFDDFDLYTGLLGGYGNLQWKEYLIQNTLDNKYSSNSFVGGLQTGVEFELSENLKFNMNLRYLVHNYKMNLELSSNYTSEFTHTGTGSISIGLQYFFSSTSPTKNKKLAYEEPIYKEEVKIAPIVVVKIDSDKDGIVDEIDNCPNTVVDEIVDKDGCAKDSDKDGVIDRLDNCQNTLENKVVDENGCVEKIETDSDKNGGFDEMDRYPSTPFRFLVDEKGCRKTYTLNIKFLYKSNIIEQKYFQEIEELSNDIIKFNNYMVVIKSHTDSIGSREYNLKLSETRARAILKKFIKYGVNKDIIIIQNMGESEPIALNDTEIGREKNRRIEIILVKKNSSGVDNE